MIRSPLTTPLYNHFERTGSNGLASKPSAAELAFQDLRGGNCDEYGKLDGLLFIVMDDGAGNWTEVVEDMRPNQAQATMEAKHAPESQLATRTSDLSVLEPVAA